MITSTGKNLSVLIMTRPGMDWQTFATWYSFRTNLPDTNVAVGCIRDGTTPFNFYQWCKRLLVHAFKFPPLTESVEEINWLDSIKKVKNWHGDELLVVRPLVVATDLVEHEHLELLNACDAWLDEDAWFFRNPDPESMLNDYFLEGKPIEKSNSKLCYEAKEHHDPKWLVCYKKGCGKWINSAKGCPFSNAGGLITADMTANEHRIIELWKKMVPLFTVVN